MVRSLIGSLAALLLAAAATSGAVAGDRLSSARDVRDVEWDDLLPAGEQQLLDNMYTNLMAAAVAVPEGGPGDVMQQYGTFNVVEDLDGARIRIGGFPVPFDFNTDHEVTEFLLVPYYGACIHAPPPPPNQIIYVTSETPIELNGIGDPIWVEGVLSADPHLDDLGNAAYSLSLTRVSHHQ